MPPNSLKNVRLTHTAAGPQAAPIPLAELPVVTFATDGCVMGYWHNVAVAVWAVTCSLELAGQLDNLMGITAEKYPQFSSLNLVTNNVGLPPADARAALSALVARRHKQVGCSATLLAGTGFWASAIRGVVTSFHVFDKHFTSSHNKIFGTVEELSEWVAPQHSTETGHPIEVQQLQQMLEWFLDQPSVRRERSHS